jgi:hypothetical protein
MSEAQAITGFFAIFGVFIGIVSEFFRERWRFNKRKELKKTDTFEQEKKLFLSPLCYYYSKCHIFFNPKVITWDDFKKEMDKLNYVEENVKKIDELMKDNMNILPVELNFDVMRSLELFTWIFNYNHNLIKAITNIDEKYLQEIPDGYKESLAKIFNSYNDMTASIFLKIYNIMKAQKDEFPQEIGKTLFEKIENAVEEMRKVVRNEEFFKNLN